MFRLIAHLILLRNWAGWSGKKNSPAFLQRLASAMGGIGDARYARMLTRARLVGARSLSALRSSGIASGRAAGPRVRGGRQGCRLSAIAALGIRKAAWMQTAHQRRLDSAIA